MATYTGCLIKIDGEVVPKIINYNVQYNKLWGEDSGRNLAGEMMATLTGIFPKITLNIGTVNEDEMAWFLAKANKAKIVVEWYDAEIKGMRTADFYSNDITTELKNSKKMIYNGFSWNVIPIKRR